MKLTNLDLQQLGQALAAFDGHQEDGKIVDRVDLPWDVSLAMARNRRALTGPIADVDAARRATVAKHTQGALAIKMDDPAAAACQDELAALDRQEVEVDLIRLKIRDLEAKDSNKRAVAPLLAALLPILDA